METLSSIYYNLFQSHILYGSTIWCYASQKNVMKIFILQKGCMRLITFTEFQENTTSILKNFKILKLQDIIKCNTSKLIYLYYKNQLPPQIKYILTTNESINLYITRVESYFSYRGLIQHIMV